MKTNRLLHWLGLCITLLALLWFANQVIQSAAAFPRLGAREFAVITLCAIVCALLALISSLVWYHLMRVVGETQARPLQAVTINALAQAGKYLPGNVAHYIGRVVLARQVGWGTNNTLFTIFIETLWSAAMAASLALVAMLSLQEALFNPLEQAPKWQILLGIAIVTMLAPLVGHRSFQSLAQWWGQRKDISISAQQLPPPRTFWLVMTFYFFNYLTMGWVLAILASQVFGETYGSVLSLTGIFAAAWITGFITPGAPAGLGVREVILVAALTPGYGPEAAVGMAASLRVVTVFSDALVFATGLGLRQFGHLNSSSK